MIEQERLIADIAKILACPPESLTAKTKMLDLVDNSFTLVELMIELQELYGIQFGQIELKSVDNIEQLHQLLSVD